MSSGKKRQAKHERKSSHKREHKSFLEEVSPYSDDVDHLVKRYGQKPRKNHFHRRGRSMLETCLAMYGGAKPLNSNSQRPEETGYNTPQKSGKKVSMKEIKRME